MIRTPVRSQAGGGGCRASPSHWFNDKSREVFGDLEEPRGAGSLHFQCRHDLLARQEPFTARMVNQLAPNLNS
jgi:hypothetical protein